MSDKYIIRNCPAYIHRPLSTHDRVCLLGDKVKPNRKELYVYCQDCTDCLLKQIVELCKYLRQKGNYEHTCEELADVEIMLEQLKLMFNCHDKVQQYKEQKLSRLKRLLQEDNQ